MLPRKRTEHEPQEPTNISRELGFPTHLRKILVSRTHHIRAWQSTRRGDHLCKRKRVMIEWIGKRNEDHWLFTSPRAKNIRHVPLQRIGAGKQARVVWKFRKHLPVIWVIASAVGEIFFQMR